MTEGVWEKRLGQEDMGEGQKSRGSRKKRWRNIMGRDCLCISCWKLGWKGMLCWDESATVDGLQ
jgi:hypothetical protein